MAKTIQNIVISKQALLTIINVIQQFNIKSIALPPLGAGNGGLVWNRVKDLIHHYQRM